MCAFHFLAQQAPDVTQYVLNAAIQLVARSTKLGWFDCQGQHQQIFANTKTLMQMSPSHCAIGLLVLHGVVRVLFQYSLVVIACRK